MTLIMYGFEIFKFKNFLLFFGFFFFLIRHQVTIDYMDGTTTCFTCEDGTRDITIDTRQKNLDGPILLPFLNYSFNFFMVGTTWIFLCYSSFYFLLHLYSTPIEQFFEHLLILSLNYSSHRNLLSLKCTIEKLQITVLF